MAISVKNATRRIVSGWALESKTRVMNRSMLSIGVATASLSVVGMAQADFPRIQLETVNSGQLVAPVGLVNAGDDSDRLFAVDQRGKIQVLQDGQVLGTPFLDIESRLVPERDGFDERGLLGLAFHPDFGTTGAAGQDKFYVYYSAPQPAGDPGDPINPVDHQSVIAEYSVTGPGSNVADPDSERILLTFDQPQFNHDAGQIGFGPDGFLYIASGDGGGGGDDEPGHTGFNAPGGLIRGNAQDRTNLLGNILRIDVDGDNGPNGQYGIPTGPGGNPFVGEGGGVREEIFAFGLRNPWRFSFDDGPGGTGELFVADVGQGNVEEISTIDPATVVAGQGFNLGWRVKEGTFDFGTNTPFDNIAPLTPPIAQYIHPNTDPNDFPSDPELLQIGLSVTGGFVYRGSAMPELVGKYIFADWSNVFRFDPANPNIPFEDQGGTLLGLDETSPGVWEISVLDVLDDDLLDQLYITTFGQDEDGELYVVTRSTLAPSDLDNGQPGGVIFKIVPEPSSLVILGIIGAAGGLSRRRKHITK